MNIYFWQNEKLIAELHNCNVVPRIGDIVKIDDVSVKVINVIWRLRDDSTGSSFIKIELGY